MEAKRDLLKKVKVDDEALEAGFNWSLVFAVRLTVYKQCSRFLYPTEDSCSCLNDLEQCWSNHFESLIKFKAEAIGADVNVDHLATSMMIGPAT
jgi:hypothetical protein